MADIERWVSADHPDRRLAPPKPDGQVMFRVDHAHEQPLVVGRLIDGRVKITARFGDAGEAARLYSADGKTLPATVVRQLAGHL